MKKPVYPYRKCGENTYEFISIGKKNIVKNVEFTPTAIEGIINLGFGDLLDDGSLNDQINSNNGDMAMVISTIINIIKAYTLINPTVKIFFQGSTEDRTRFYGRVIKTYYQEFTGNFMITGLRLDTMTEEAFNPDHAYIYEVYFIQRIT